MLRSLRWLTLLLGCAACSSQETSPPLSSRNPPPTPASKPSVRVLFIGNSYTEVNNLPTMFAQFVQALSPQTQVEQGSVLQGGATLEGHWVQGTARDQIHASSHWNYVVLQEQSLLGHVSVDGTVRMAPPEELFFPYAQLFAQDILSVKSTPVFYMTWSRKNDLPAQQVLSWAYAHAAHEQNGVLAAVGVAWQRVRQERPEVELYAGDGEHPSPAGTYLAACVLYTSILHQSCVGAPATLSQLPEETARYLQQVGSDVGLATALPEVPATRPTTTVLPGLPSGSPWDAQQATGSWQGSLAFFSRDQGLSPIPLQLTLDFQGARPSGHVRIQLPQGAPLEADVVPGVEGNVLTFSMNDPQILGTPLSFRAVLASGGLRGVTTAEDSQQGHWYGSWSVTPMSK